MQNDYSLFKIPSLARPKVYDFAESKESFELYQELNQIAEDIEKCRLRNLI